MRSHTFLSIFNCLLFTVVSSSHIQPILRRDFIHSAALSIRQNTGAAIIARQSVKQPEGFFDRFRKERKGVSPTISSPMANDRYRQHVPYAANAYCPNLAVGSKVGTDGVVLWKMGDGNKVQRVFVAYSPTLGIVVSHQGTNSSSYESIANDIDFALKKPFKELRWLGHDVEIGEGFQEAWGDTAQQVLMQVKLARKTYPDASVVTTGHSLGASTALLCALDLSHQLGHAITINAITFGLPRTGNSQFANAADRYLFDQRHIVHYRDPVPHLPARGLGYRHNSGEVWIANEQGSLVYQCPGQENSQCSNSVSIFKYDASDHHGPYFGIGMSCVP